MRLTRHTDYALRVLIHLAKHGGRLCSISEIAALHAISQDHLMKVANQMVHAGFVESVRGRNGGIRLARANEDITVGAVVRACEPSLDLADCADCALMPGCGLTPVLGEAMTAFLAVLDTKTLADIMPRTCSAH